MRIAFLFSLLLSLYASIVGATPGQLGFSIGVVVELQ